MHACMHACMHAYIHTYTEGRQLVRRHKGRTAQGRPFSGTPLVQYVTQLGSIHMYIYIYIYIYHTSLTLYIYIYIYIHTYV